MHKNSPFLYKKYKNFLGREHSPLQTIPLGAFGARHPVPLSGGLDTRPCKISDPPLRTELFEPRVEKCAVKIYV